MTTNSALPREHFLETTSRLAHKALIKNGRVHLRSRTEGGALGNDAPRSDSIGRQHSRAASALNSLR
ncbi:MAG TPA: hypothetical protein VE175_12305, partial [Woeseiaceae bacterium]|nr:hypothetical protein [Woeseiaceae bacterium]